MVSLRTEDLSLKLGQQMICHHLNLLIKPGEIWGILGQNGSGKTTLLHTLGRLFRPQSGEIFLQEKKINAFSQRQLAQTIGILFQDSNPVFAQSVFEFCLSSRYPHQTYFRKESMKDKKITLYALETLELTPLHNRKVTELSGGEKRRLSMSCLLAQTPSVYLLDEPMNHLDVRYQMLALNHFRYLALSEAKSIVMTLHDVNIAQQFCDRILLLFGNGDTMQGSPKDILTTENLSRLYEHPMTLKSQSFWWPRI